MLTFFNSNQKQKKTKQNKKNQNEIKYLVIAGDLYLNRVCFFFTVLRSIHCHAILYKETEITNYKQTNKLASCLRHSSQTLGFER